MENHKTPSSMTPVLLMAAGAAIVGVSLYFYLRPPRMTPVSKAGLERIKKLQGHQGDVDV